MTPRPCLLLLLVAGCTDYDLSGPGTANTTGEPEIAVTPRSLDFLGAGADEVVLRSFSVANVGDVFLQVDRLELAGGGSFTIVEDPLTAGIVGDGSVSLDLFPGDWFEVEVAMSPVEPGPLQAQVVVHSTDADEPEIPVSLLGEGLVPKLQITPSSYDFGAVTPPCPDDVELILQNVGATDLNVSALAYLGDGALDLVDQPDLPLVLAPGAWSTARVRFQPGAEGAFSGSLEAISDDPQGARTASQQGSGAPTDRVEERFEIEDDPPLDILFAVDQSASMDDDAAALGANFSTFIEAVGSLTASWQIGVVTLDEACVNGGVLTASSPGLAVAFQAAVSLGEDRDIVDDEALLKLSARALDQAAPGACNEGFLREDALVHVVVVSDEPERSHEQAAAWTWDFWVEALQEEVSEPARLVISGVVDADGCNEGDEGYAQAIAATGGEHLSICSDAWAEHLAALADVTSARLWSWTLEGEPDVSTIEVEVDGVETTGWVYDPDTRLLSFDEDPGGSEVVVSYLPVGECD